MRTSSDRRRRPRLLEWMGARERVDLRQLVGDANEVRERRRVDVEEFRAGRLAGDAGIGERHLVAGGEFAGLLALEVRLEPGERLGVPVPAPRRDGLLVMLELMLEILAHARHDQRMGVRGDELRKAAHPGPAARVLWEQRRARMRLVEILD